jgi:hypothetical protein
LSRGNQRILGGGHPAVAVGGGAPLFDGATGYLRYRSEGGSRDPNDAVATVQRSVVAQIGRGRPGGAAIHNTHLNELALCLLRHEQPGKVNQHIEAVALGRA